jgi:hypothetical protein
VATAVALGAALAGCGSENDATAEAEDKPSASASSAAPTEKPEGRLLTAADAKAALPAVGELPGSGWSNTPVATEESSPTVTPAKCAPVMNELSTDFGGYKPKLAAKEGVKFTNESAGETELLFEVASWTNEADANLPLAAAELVDDCKSFSASDEGTTLEFTAEKLTPLAIGEKQTAVHLAASFQGATVHLIVHEMKVGHNLISLVQTSPDATDHAKEYQPVVEAMIADLQKAA